jgi:hypothetical protein
MVPFPSASVVPLLRLPIQLLQLALHIRHLALLRCHRLSLAALFGLCGFLLLRFRQRQAQPGHQRPIAMDDLHLFAPLRHFALPTLGPASMLLLMGCNSLFISSHALSVYLLDRGSACREDSPQ